MDFGKSIDGFQFENELPVDNEVKALEANVGALEKDVNLLLPFIRDAAMLQGDFPSPFDR